MIDVKADFGAKGDGSTDDRQAITSAFAAAALIDGPAAVRFPPGVYIVSQQPNQPYCLEVPGSNIQLWGVKGRSWIKAKAGLSGPVSVLLIRQRFTVTIRDLGIDGNWGNVKTEIAAESHNLGLTGTINVASTAGFPAPAGSLVVITVDGTSQPISYTGVTLRSFTGCTGGVGTLSIGAAVGYIDGNIGINHATAADPHNHGIMIRGAREVLIENCLIRQCYGDGIWIGPDSTDLSMQAFNIKIRDTNIDMGARSGIAIGGVAENLHVTGCRFTNIYAQAFDTEPEGSSGYARDVTVEKTFLDGWWNPANPRRSINSPLSIQGGRVEVPNESNRARQYRVRDCTIKGSVMISDAIDVIFERNRVLCDFPGFSYAPVYVTADCDDVWILDNYIYDRTTASAGDSHDAAISVQTYSAGNLNQQPAGVHVRGNRIHARCGRHGIKVEGTGSFALGNAAQMPNEAGAATDIGAAATTISLPSDGKILPQVILNVVSTSAFPASGTILITTHAQVEKITYTGKTATTLTGCSGGANELHTSDAVTAYSLTDNAKIWTLDQWTGKTVRTGGAQGTVLSNTPTQLILDPAGWRTMLGNPADPAVAPPVGPYAIYGSSALVDIENNTIECTDDGFGHGGYGIYLYAFRSGMRVRCHRNQIINAGGDAIRVVTVNTARPILHLEITDNIAVDTQPSATCTHLANFTNVAGTTMNPFIKKWIMRGNSPGIYPDGTQMPTYGGLSAPVAWIVTDGEPTDWTGYGTPEGLVRSQPGSTYRRLDGTASAFLYVKETRQDDTGWVAARDATPAWVDQLDLAGGNFDPVILGIANATLAAGNAFLSLVRVYKATFSKVLLEVGGAIDGAAHCFVGVYKHDGTQTAAMAAATVDALSSASSLGVKTITLAHPVTVTVGDDIYLAILVTGTPTTALQLSACSANPTLNGILTAGQGLRSGVFGSGLTALPPNIAPAGMTAAPAMVWLGTQ